MAKYVTYLVPVPVEVDGELAKRLEKAAQRTGLSVQQVVETTVQLGIYGTISRNLDLLENTPAK